MPFDITIWRLNGSFSSSNDERDSLIAQTDAEYLGNRSHFFGIATCAIGFVFRFGDQTKADEFINTVKSHELPAEEIVEAAPVVEKTVSKDELKAEKKAEKKAAKQAKAQPKDTDSIDLINADGKIISVKRKDVDNLLERGWRTSNAALRIKEKDPKGFEPKDDDWVVMWSGNSFLRVRRGKVWFLESVGWRKAWDLYRDKHTEFEKTKIQMAQELFDLNDEIETLQEKDDGE